MKTAPIELKTQSTTPTTPSAGYVTVFANTTAVISFVDESGTVTNIDGSNPQGNYNANTNSPDISSPATGDIYKVATAGIYDINGDGAKGTRPGTNDMSSGFNFDSSAYDFWVSVNGGSTAQITLDSNCANVTAILAELNAETSQAGVSGMEAYSPSTSTVGLRTSLTGTGKSITLYAGTKNLLALCGMTSGTGTGTNGSDVDHRVDDVLIRNNNSSWIHIKDVAAWGVENTIDTQLSLTDNTTTVVVTLGSVTTYKAFGIKATLDDGTDYAVFPEFFVLTDGTTALVENKPPYIGSDFSTVSFNADISGGNARLNFITSVHGSNPKFMYDITTYIGTTV